MNKLIKIFSESIGKTICIILMMFAIINFVICAYNPTLFKMVGAVVGVNVFLFVLGLLFYVFKYEIEW